MNAQNLKEANEWAANAFEQMAFDISGGMAPEPPPAANTLERIRIGIESVSDAIAAALLAAQFTAIDSSQASQRQLELWQKHTN